MKVVYLLCHANYILVKFGYELNSQCRQQRTLQVIGKE